MIGWRQSRLAGSSEVNMQPRQHPSTRTCQQSAVGGSSGAWQAWLQRPCSNRSPQHPAHGRGASGSRTTCPLMLHWPAKMEARHSCSEALVPCLLLYQPSRVNGETSPCRCQVARGLAHSRSGFICFFVVHVTTHSGSRQQ